jgi:hypothetical protein
MDGFVRQNIHRECDVAYKFVFLLICIACGELICRISSSERFIFVSIFIFGLKQQRCLLFSVCQLIILNRVKYNKEPSVSPIYSIIPLITNHYSANAIAVKNNRGKIKKN